MERHQQSAQQSSDVSARSSEEVVFVREEQVIVVVSDHEEAKTEKSATEEAPVKLRRTSTVIPDSVNKFEIFQNSLTSYLLQEIRYYKDVVQHRVKPRPDAVDKIKQGAKFFLSLGGIVGFNAKPFFEVLDTVATAILNRLEKSQTAKLPLPALYRCLIKEPPQEKLKLIAEAAAKQASCFFNAILFVGFRDEQQREVDHLAMVAALRILDYLMEHDKPFEVQHILQGIFVGRSGSGAESIFDHKLHLSDKSPLTAEQLFQGQLVIVKNRLYRRTNCPEQITPLAIVQLSQDVFESPNFPKERYLPSEMPLPLYVKEPKYRLLEASEILEKQILSPNTLANQVFVCGRFQGSVEQPMDMRGIAFENLNLIGVGFEHCHLNQFRNCFAPIAIWRSVQVTQADGMNHSNLTCSELDRVTIAHLQLFQTKFDWCSIRESQLPPKHHLFRDVVFDSASEAHILKDEQKKDDVQVKPIEEDQFFGFRPSNPKFFPRPDVLAKMQEILQVANKTALVGMGGSGKTQIALHYGYTCSSSFPYKLWFTADSKETLHDAYRSFGLEFKFLDGKEEPKEVLRKVHSFFKEHNGQCLLIYDNVDTFPLDEFRDFLVLGPNFKNRVIITSRQREAWDTQLGILNEQMISLHELEPKAAQEMFDYLSNTPQSSPKLMKLLGYLPLSIALAAGYVKTTRASISALTRQLELQPAAIFAAKTSKAQVDHTPILNMFQASLQSLDENGHHGLEILEACAYLAPDNIPIRFLKRWFAQGFAEKEDERAMMEVTWNSLLGQLRNLSMITISEDDSVLSIHRVVQLAIRHRHQSQPTGEDGTSAIAPSDRLNCHSSYPSDGKEWFKKFLALLTNEITMDDQVPQVEYHRSLLPHIKHCLDASAKLAEKSMLQDLQSAAADCSQYEIGNPMQAKEWYLSCLEFKEGIHGPEHYEVASTLINLANAYGDLGDPQTQKSLLERALKINEKHYGPDHYQVAITLDCLANAYGDLGDPQTKKSMLERALAIDEKHYGANHYELAITLTSLANAYGDLGDLQKKKSMLERALKINEKHYGVDHYRVATILGYLADTYGDLGDRQTALTMFQQRVFPIFERHYGKSHQYTEWARSQFAKLL